MRIDLDMAQLSRRTEGTGKHLPVQKHRTAHRGPECDKHHTAVSIPSAFAVLAQRGSLGIIAYRNALDPGQFPHFVTDVHIRPSQVHCQRDNAILRHRSRHRQSYPHHVSPGQAIVQTEIVNCLLNLMAVKTSLPSVNPPKELISFNAV